MSSKPKQPCVYILASKRDGILYVGVTSHLADRVGLHKQDVVESFTKKYGVHTLVYYEMHEAMPAAIRRERQLKKWNRAWKVRLIQQLNPEWRDLWTETGEVHVSPAGGQVLPSENLEDYSSLAWMPAFAGMTSLSDRGAGEHANQVR